MGAHLLVTAIAYRPTWKISGRAFDVLIRMCVSALDEPNEDNPGCLYFGGWVPLAMMLGYDAPMNGEPLPAKAQQAVWRATSELIAAGIIDTVDDDSQRDYRYRAYRILL